MDVPQVVPMKDATIGDMGQRYLATGKQVALRRWQEDAGEFSTSRARSYETVGYVLSGVLEVDLNGGSAILRPGDSWMVPQGASHRYRILEDVVVIEATSPPARFNERDEP